MSTFQGTDHKPHKVIIDKSGSNTYALKDINQEYKDKNIENIEIIQKKYLNNIVESDHRFIKKITNRMLGFKSFYCAEKTLAGIEVVHMIRKNQMKNEGNTDYEQFASLISQCQKFRKNKKKVILKIVF